MNRSLRLPQEPFQGYTWLSFFVFALSVGAFMLGMSMGTRLTAPPPTVVKCHSSDALNGSTWFVDLTKPLFAQDCTTHSGFPGKLLCKRQVTIACDVPKGATLHLDANGE